MSYVIKNIEHYLNFLEHFYAIPSSFHSREEIESSQIYQEGFRIINEIKPVFMEIIFNKLQTYNINFDYYRYEYNNNIKYQDSIYNLFDFYSNVELLKKYIINIVDSMIRMDKFTDASYLEIYNKLKMDTANNIYYYIDILRTIPFFNNMFFSKFMNGGYQNNNHLHYNLILISGEGHAIIIIKNNISKNIILFDPSYNISNSKKYFYLLNIFGYGYSQNIITIDVQNVVSLYQDIFCFYWCFHFIYWFFINNISPEIYKSMFINTNTYRYIYEIKIFILKIIRESQIFEKYKDIYWRKYMKYKTKYLELKK
jgi:hypothetical protein